MESPPLLSISLNTPSGRLKNTAANILATKQFTVNIISEPFTQAANWCSIDTPPDKSEWIGSGLTKEPSVGCFIPFLD
jgi:flavin reductase (DIM6/NTAB) family NADH-FMN oxidoreductase RutF